MTSINRSLFNYGKSLILSQSRRSITITSVNRIKEFVEKKEGNTLIIEAKIIPDPFRDKLFKATDNGACSLCAAGVDVKHTDVLILKEFLGSDGRLLPRRVTNLCKIQQKRVSVMLQMAIRAGLMNVLSKKTKKPLPCVINKGFNTYYDEISIKSKYYNSTFRN
ncbi:39S ribosomal protein S18a, mitochondrial [Microplitis mediator]|uniref:39S ribosomal protein S18a, mitochondrial n=1 Tax=Microplitis mediator TaxID=375433 RepID=UPI00255383BA|nr:39S ribosomal protein S18a, mitochondrial [Microplitis mediator]